MKPCNSCPFRKGTSNYGTPDWLIDVLKGIMSGGLQHSCHKTDPKADGYVGHKSGKDSICIGAAAMLAHTGQVQDKRIAFLLAIGEIDEEDLRGDDVFRYPNEMIMHHYREIKRELLND